MTAGLVVTLPLVAVLIVLIVRHVRGTAPWWYYVVALGVALVATAVPVAVVGPSGRAQVVRDTCKNSRYYSCTNNRCTMQPDGKYPTKVQCQKECAKTPATWIVTGVPSG